MGHDHVHPNMVDLKTMAKKTLISRFSMRCKSRVRKVHQLSLELKTTVRCIRMLIPVCICGVFRETEGVITTDAFPQSHKELFSLCNNNFDICVLLY